jgi:hypothetical protein
VWYASHPSGIAENSQQIQRDRLFRRDSAYNKPFRIDEKPKQNNHGNFELPGFDTLPKH